MRKISRSNSVGKVLQELELLAIARLCEGRSRKCRELFWLEEGVMEDCCIDHWNPAAEHGPQQMQSSDLRRWSRHRALGRVWRGLLKILESLQLSFLPNKLALNLRRMKLATCSEVRADVQRIENDRKCFVRCCAS